MPLPVVTILRLLLLREKFGLLRSLKKTIKLRVHLQNLDGWKCYRTVL
uniref:Uncharacterized protein n=1 Tax=Daphnia galeata TaxID=27404 RepID=A0A8J2WFJ8_9CRUS|nr:unnamed protein product [Daphnia galeata]